MIFVSGLPIQSNIEQIVMDVKMEVENAGIPLLQDVKVSGENVMVTCPVHKGGQEDKPSCGITITDLQRGNRTIPAGTVNCFTCGFVASLPEFISTVFGYSDRGKFGFKWLSRNYSYVEIEKREPIKFDFNKTKNEPVVSYVTEEELQKYRFTHPYMYQRGLTPDWVDYFDVGYDKETRSITFPVKDKEGNCLFVQRRSVKGKRFENDEEATKNTLFAIDKLYQPGNFEFIVDPVGYVAIVESPIDVITLWQWGIPCLGTLQAIPSQEQLDLINELPVDTLLSAQDNDLAGKIGATRLRDKTNKLIKRLIFPRGVKDVNDMTQEQFDNATKTVAWKSIRSFKEG